MECCGIGVRQVNQEGNTKGSRSTTAITAFHLLVQDSKPKITDRHAHKHVLRAALRVLTNELLLAESMFLHPGTGDSSSLDTVLLAVADAYHDRFIL